MARPRAASEPFDRLPARAYEALEAGELAFEEWAVLAYLAHAVGPRPYVGTTVRGLMERMDWPWGDDKLRRTLRALRAKGWIDYEVRERQRRPYAIRLTGAAVRRTAGSDDAAAAQTAAAATAASTAADDPTPLRQSTAAWLQSLHGATPDDDSASGATQLPQPPVPTDQSRPDQMTDGLRPSGAAAPLPPNDPAPVCDPLPLPVREFLARLNPPVATAAVANVDNDRPDADAAADLMARAGVHCNCPDGPPPGEVCPQCHARRRR